MLNETELAQKFEAVFERQQAVVLAEAITEAYSDLVKTGDFNELKAIVKDLADAQRRTEQRMGELADAQKRTEHALQLLAQGLTDTRAELGGLSRSVSYALENEAYRALPAFLKERHGITMSERLIRAEVGGEEIDVLGSGLRDGESVLVVGEAKLRLVERGEARGETVFSSLDRKIAVVRTVYPEATVVPMLLTHYARPGFVQAAQDRGVIVVQSFEW